MHVEYESNNSGGSWWLTDQNWKDLEKAGWKVRWANLSFVYKDGKTVYDNDGLPLMLPQDQVPISAGFTSYTPSIDKDGRYLGCLAKEAYKPNCNSLEEAVEEWERITGANALDAGCSCCGQPHNFTLYGNQGEFIKSGPSFETVGSW